VNKQGNITLVSTASISGRLVGPKGIVEAAYESNRKANGERRFYHEKHVSTADSPGAEKDDHYLLVCG